MLGVQRLSVIGTAHLARRIGDPGWGLFGTVCNRQRVHVGPSRDNLIMIRLRHSFVSFTRWGGLCTLWTRVRPIAH